MLVSSIGYMVGNVNAFAVSAELSKAQAGDVVNRGLNTEDKKGHNPLIQSVSDVFKAFLDPEVKNAKRTLDMIA